MLAADTEGITALVASLGAAAADLEDLSGTDEKAGDLVLGAVTVPRDKGDLAASLSSALGVVSASAPHARFVHFGTRHMRARPFLTDALDAKAAAVVDLYTDRVETAVSHLKGT